MKIFLDVGANTGQSLPAATDTRYGFDRIVSFEPAPECWEAIESVDDDRIELCRFGLSNQTGTAELHDAGSLSGSIYEDLDSLAEGSATTKVDLVRASDWFRENVGDRDTVFMKLNCEGSECDILEDLLESGELRKVYSVVVSFDVRNSPTLRAKEAPLRRRMRKEGYMNLASSDDIMRGRTHDDRIRCWLDFLGADQSLELEELRQRYDARLKYLGRRTGSFARFEQQLRVRIFDHLPPGLKDIARTLWRRLVNPPREGQGAPTAK